MGREGLGKVEQTNSKIFGLRVFLALQLDHVTWRHIGDVVEVSSLGKFLQLVDEDVHEHRFQCFATSIEPHPIAKTFLEELDTID